MAKNHRKSAKRVAAGKKAARTRKRNAAKKHGHKKANKNHRKSPKRVAAGKKAARTRKRNAAKRKKARK